MHVLGDNGQPAYHIIFDYTRLLLLSWPPNGTGICLSDGTADAPNGESSISPAASDVLLRLRLVLVHMRRRRRYLRQRRRRINRRVKSIIGISPDASGAAVTVISIVTATQTSTYVILSGASLSERHICQVFFSPFFHE